MPTFKRLVKIAGYLAAISLFAILAIVFFVFVTKDTMPNIKTVTIKSKAEAQSVDMWRISNGGLKKYRLIASNMIKTKSDLVILKNAKLWYFEKNKPDVFIKADEVVVYKNNNVDAKGNVFLMRKDLRINASEVFWNAKNKTLSTKTTFKAVSKKFSFLGKNFIYYLNSDEFISSGADVWLK